jgi:hypothetical protein
VIEGDISGSVIQAGTGRKYQYEGHFLADGHISYSARIYNAEDAFLGSLEGSLPRDGRDAEQVDAIVRNAVSAALQEGSQQDLGPRSMR